jgi:hypothetical protein
MAATSSQMTLAPASLMLWGGSTGVRLIVWCRDRRHRVEPDPASAALRRRGDLPNWRERLVCSECRFERGLNTADVPLLRLFTPDAYDRLLYDRASRGLEAPARDESWRRRRFPQQHGPPRVQSVPNDIDGLTTVDPWRDSAAEMRFYQTAPPAIWRPRRTGLLAGA